MDESSSSGSPDGGDIAPSKLDPLLSILRDPLRRRTVRFCASASDRMFEFDDLVDHLARGDGLSADARSREEIAIDLHHGPLRSLPILRSSSSTTIPGSSGISGVTGLNVGSNGSIRKYPINRCSTAGNGSQFGATSSKKRPRIRHRKN